MTEQSNRTKEEVASADDEISLRELLLKIGEWWRYLLSKWLIIGIACIIGGILGLSYSFWKKPVYTASLSFVLEDQKAGGGLGQMSNLASMIGISLGGMEGEGLFTSDNIMEFIKSKRMIRKTLLTKVNLEGKEQLLVDRYVELNNIKENWKEDENLANFKFIADSSDYYLQDSLITTFYKSILNDDLLVDKLDKKLSIMQVDIESADELFAKAFCEALIQNVTDFYIENRTRKSVENLTILTRQVDSVRRELNAALGGMAAATDANPNANAAFQALRVPSQKRQVDVQANTAILTELVKQQELAKLNVQNDKPLIQSLDRPTLPLEKEQIGKIKGLILGAFVLGFLTTILLIMKRIYRQIMFEANSYERIED